MAEITPDAVVAHSLLGRYSNDAEDSFARWAASRGWQVTKRGWPDFICRRDREFMAVEVKDSDTLSPYQRAAAIDLTARGVPVYIWHIQEQRLEPVSDVTQLMTDRDVSALVLADELSVRLAQSTEENQRLYRKIRNLEAALETSRRGERAEAAQLRQGNAKLADDIAYVLRQIQDSPSLRSQRMDALLKRHCKDTYRSTQELNAWIATASEVPTPEGDGASIVGS